MVRRLGRLPRRKTLQESLPHAQKGRALPGQNASRGSRKKSPRLGTVRDQADAWAEAQTPASRKHCRRVARDLKAIAGDLDPRQLTPLHWQGIVNTWKQTLATSTTHTDSHCLRRLARNIGAIAKIPNLHKDVPRAKVPQPRTTIVTPEEISKLLAVSPPWFQVFITVATALGLRHSEILDLKIEGWNADKKTVTFTAKGGERRTMPTTEEIHAIFANAPPGAPLTPLIELYKGTPVNRNSTWWEWKKSKRFAGITREIMPRKNEGDPPEPRGPPHDTIARQVSRIADKEKNRQRSRASYERKKAAGTLTAKPPQTSEQRARYNANRREKAGRTRLSAAERQEDEVREKRSAGLAIVSASAIRLDHTRWKGPGARRELELEEKANAILRSGRSDRSDRPEQQTAEVPIQAPEPEPPTFRELLVERWLKRMRL